jgi:plasmid stabilization system protein ParE
MKPLIIHPMAAKDAREIAAMYAEVSRELRDQFWGEIDAAVDAIENYPERHHFDPSGRRRSNLKKFPYHILFEERLQYNRIIVIRHHHRNPRYGLRRE